jgi:2-polyprenyl-3-methyl-5-hydroxy-6-metoxy-1,4-benzoquinol methylase
MFNPARFSTLVRRGLRFRRTFESAKASIGSAEFDWYPYDSFSNLFCLQQLLVSAQLSLDTVTASRTILDIGAGDGALSFFMESLGYKVHAWDNSATNMNRMSGIRSLARALGSQIEITDADVDKGAAFVGYHGLALFLGILYHLRNPYGVLESLAHSARYCLLSTRIARLSKDRSVSMDAMPVAWLLDEAETNSDATNYWIFSYPGLLRLVSRTGWRVCSALTTGAAASDPVSPGADERAFLLLESRILSA